MLLYTFIRHPATAKAGYVIGITYGFMMQCTLVKATPAAPCASNPQKGQSFIKASISVLLDAHNLMLGLNHKYLGFVRTIKIVGQSLAATIQRRRST